MRANWWRFWHKTTNEVDVFTLANLPIYMMVKKEAPFDKWRHPSVELDEKYTSLIRVGVWGYQVYMFNKLVEVKFGQEVARLVLTDQIIALNRYEQLGEDFGKLFNLIDQAVNTKPIKAPTDQGEITIPVEMNIALWLLVRMDNSPYYIAPAGINSDKVPDIGDEIDWKFAECLAFGKDASVRVFSPIIDNVALIQASVAGLRMSATSS